MVEHSFTSNSENVSLPNFDTTIGQEIVLQIFFKYKYGWPDIATNW